MEEKIKIQKDDNNMAVDNLYPCDWSKPNRFKNYIAKILNYEKGTEEREYITDKSYSSGYYFDCSGLHENDIIVASCWDDRKRRGEKQYYVVCSNCDDCIELDGGYNTYLQARKAVLSKHQNE